MQENTEMIQVATGALNGIYNLVERAPFDELEKQYGIVQKAHAVSDMIDLLNVPIMILNRFRQVIFMNTTCRKLVNVYANPVTSWLGKRPGEILYCVNGLNAKEGCGTDDACKQCGAFRVIFETVTANLPCESEWRILKKDSNEALDLLVKSTPFTIETEPFILFTIADISSEKRRAILEKIFFHDVLNTAGAIKGSIDLLLNGMKNDESKHDQKLAEIIFEASDNLVKDIQMHRSLLSAEHNELSVSHASINSLSLLTEVAEIYRNHPASEGRRIDISSSSIETTFVSDPLLLSRILGNMIKNALEATPLEKAVTVSTSLEQNHIRFEVKNPGYIPQDVQYQIFQRSFSTKGRGRGIGTYSMKLLTEKYLGGTISFMSTPSEGTVFFATYPMAPTIRM